MCNAVRLMHGFAFKLRPRKTRCLPARGDRDASGQNSLMMRGVQLLNARLAWMLLWSRFVLLERIQPGKEMLVRVVAVLTKLVERFDPYQNRVRESVQALTDPLEHEDDDEHEAAVATLWRALAGVGRDVGLRRAQSSRLAKSGRLIR